MENVRKYSVTKLVITKKKKKLFSMRTKLSYKKFFTENLLAREMKKNANFN